MEPVPPSRLITRAELLVRGTPTAHERWIRARGAAGWAEPVCFVAAGGAAYGAAMGAWSGPELAAYTAIKLPLLLVATSLVDAVINGLWARRLGLDLSFGESLRAVLLAF